MSEDDIRRQFTLFDTDNSGDLDIEEYEDFCSRTRTELPVLSAQEKKIAKENRWTILNHKYTVFIANI